MSSISTLKERINEYENATNLKLIRRVPLFISLNGRGFRKTTSLLEKPFAADFFEIIGAVMVKLMQEVDGSVFSYSCNDEILLVALNNFSNETNAWYDNNIQNIVSASSSIATLEFAKQAGLKNINILGDPVFLSKAFVVPNITEAINVFISKQQQGFHISLYNAVYFELLRKYKPETVREALLNKTSEEKIEILMNETKINYNNYPLPFRRGFGCYRTPRIIKTNEQNTVKDKLFIDDEVPIFSQDYEFLSNILKSGKGSMKI